MKRTSTTTALAGFALAAAFGLSVPVEAQPSLEQTGDGYSVVYGPADRGQPAGGRVGRLMGGGDGAEVLYTGPDPVHPGSAAALSGGGDNATITYATPASAAGMANKGPTRGAGRRG